MNDVLKKHLILDQYGNYGGVLNRSKYGDGAPLNGKYDVEDSPYYVHNDYYNMKSTATRTIYPNFLHINKLCKIVGYCQCFNGFKLFR